MIALDIETSGLDCERCSILSIGALDTENPENQFYGECRAWEGAEVSIEALAINGFSEAAASDPSKQSEAELITQFSGWLAPIQNKIIVGQNSSFDRDFVRSACKRAGESFPFAHRTIDVHSLVWLHMINRKLEPPVKDGNSMISLTFALEYCGLPEELKPHNALNGAFAHTEVFSRIAYTKKMLPQYVSFEIPWLN
jgi:DNA polymerase III epsilon subunit-like protein